MDTSHLFAFKEALESPTVKTALLERLVRLGLTDIPKTPRLLMKKRTPEQLANVQHGIDAAFHKVQGPLMEKSQKLITGKVNPDKYPRVHKSLVGGANLLIQNPEALLLEPVMIPGLTPAYVAGKKMLERGIDKLAPLRK